MASRALGRLRRNRAAALLAVVVAAGCDASGDEPQRLELVEFVQDRHADVFLDEPLVLHFSAPLDRTSINASTLRITDEEGEIAAGRVRIDGRKLTYRAIDHRGVVRDEVVIKKPRSFGRR